MQQSALFTSARSVAEPTEKPDISELYGACIKDTGKTETLIEITKDQSQHPQTRRDASKSLAQLALLYTDKRAAFSFFDVEQGAAVLRAAYSPELVADVINYAANTNKFSMGTQVLYEAFSDRPEVFTKAVYEKLFEKSGVWSETHLSSLKPLIGVNPKVAARVVASSDKLSGLIPKLAGLWCETGVDGFLVDHLNEKLRGKYDGRRAALDSLQHLAQHSLAAKEALMESVSSGTLSSYVRNTLLQSLAGKRYAESGVKTSKEQQITLCCQVLEGGPAKADFVPSERTKRNRALAFLPFRDPLTYFVEGRENLAIERGLLPDIDTVQLKSVALQILASLDPERASAYAHAALLDKKSSVYHELSQFYAR